MLFSYSVKPTFTVENEKAIVDRTSRQLRQVRLAMTPFLRLFSTLLFALATLLAGAAPAHAQLKDVPKLTARVTDQAGMLDATQRQRLEAVLADYEARTVWSLIKDSRVILSMMSLWDWIVIISI